MFELVGLLACVEVEEKKLNPPLPLEERVEGAALLVEPPPKGLDCPPPKVVEEVEAFEFD